MNILIVSEKPALSRAIAPVARAYWPTDSIAFVHTTPYGNFKFSYPRGLKLAEYPVLSEPRHHLNSWDGWHSPSLEMARDGTLAQRGTGLDLFTAAELIVYACYPDYIGAISFDLLLASVFGDARALACPALRLDGLDAASITRALAGMRPFGEAFASALAYGRMKRYFDWNWNANGLAILSGAQRRAGVPAQAPPLSKYALQLLYGLRGLPPRTDGQVINLMQRWPGTGRYQYQHGEGRPRLGSPASVTPILENLVTAGLLERTLADGPQVVGLSGRGHTLLGLLHPDCQDADLPFRLNAWCEQGAASKPAVDRYLRMFFGKQKRFATRIQQGGEK